MDSKKEELLLKSLPNYLKHDIKAVEENKLNKECKVYDCLLGELYGSINGALWDKIISEEEANYLRDKYYFDNLIYLEREYRV